MLFEIVILENIFNIWNFLSKKLFSSTKNVINLLRMTIKQTRCENGFKGVMGKAYMPRRLLVWHKLENVQLQAKG